MTCEEDPQTEPCGSMDLVETNMLLHIHVKDQLGATADLYALGGSDVSNVDTRHK